MRVEVLPGSDIILALNLLYKIIGEQFLYRNVSYFCKFSKVKKVLTTVGDSRKSCICNSWVTSTNNCQFLTKLIKI